MIYITPEDKNIIIEKYNSILRKLTFKLPPIIYHYKAKNILCFSEKYFYYKNPRGVEKFKTSYSIREIKKLIEYFKNNKYISWNN